MEAAESLREHIRQLEERLLRPDVRRARQTLDELLAGEFTEFASDGVAYSKEQVIEALEREAPYVRSLTDFRIVELAESVVLAIYRINRQNVTLNEVSILCGVLSGHYVTVAGNCSFTKVRPVLR